MKKIVVRLVVLLVIGAAGAVWWFYLKPKEKTDDRIFVSGNIEAKEVDLSFRIGGQIAKFPIEEGDSVKAGQVAAELDTDTLLTQKSAAMSEQEAARAVFDELKAGTRKEQIDAARAVLKAAKSRHENAEAEFERYHPLFKAGAISASQFDSRQTTLRVAVEELNNAAERLRELEKGPREEQIRAAEHRMRRAEWELKRIDLDFAHSVLTCPVDGVILVKSNEAGEVVLPSAPIATIGRVDEVWLKGYVGEQDLGKVKLGQKVEVTTDSYPGKPYVGTITFISSKAEFTPKNVQTKEERVKQVYRVKVTIPNLHQELKIGMPAEGHVAKAAPRDSGGAAAAAPAPTADKR
ncbi:MAG: efflux RND transporter periplasmic adaptor subunit [Pseudomonadota bacterium]